MKQKIEKLLESLIPLGIGLISSSLWWTHNDNWKTYLPIVLLLMAIQRLFDKYNKYNK